MRVFAFHFAGGAASAYREWPGLLPDSVDLVALQMPGREGRLRDPLLDSMDAVLSEIEKPVLEQMDLPYVIYGHSMGALISFELMRKFRREGRTLPRKLFLSGRRSPRLPCRFPDIHDLPHDDLIEAMRKYGGTPEQILNEPDLMEMILPIVRADFKLLEKYSYQAEEPFDFPISIYGGRDDIRTTREELLAWGMETRGEYLLRMFDGEHFFISTNREPVVESLNAELNAVVAGL